VDSDSDWNLRLQGVADTTEESFRRLKQKNFTAGSQFGFCTPDVEGAVWAGSVCDKRFSCDIVLPAWRMASAMWEEGRKKYR